MMKPAAREMKPVTGETYCERAEFASRERTFAGAVEQRY